MRGQPAGQMQTFTWEGEVGGWQEALYGQAE